MSEPIVTKTCSKCKELKQLSDFHINRHSKDGHFNKCKICWLKYCKEYKQTKNGKATQKRYQQKSINFKTYQKQYKQSEKGKAVQIAAHKRYYLQYPNRKKAKCAVSTATRRSKMPKVDTLQCQYCPAQAEQYHHYKGYAKEHWLDVIPTCRKCHIMIHFS